jgi:coproporphyrinogen III oxidase-like Fe-S oxidoreductase
MDSCILDIARHNLNRSIEESRASILPAAGGRWANYCSQARVTIGRFSNPQEVIHYVQSANTGFETRSTGEALEQHCRALEDVCQTLFPEFAHTMQSFVETPLSTPETLMSLRGRIVSTPLLWHMRVIMAIVSRFLPDCVLEIGGGYGAPAVCG